MLLNSPSLFIYIWHSKKHMMTSSNGHIFRVTGLLCGEFTGPRWVLRKGQWRRAVMFPLIYVWIHGCANNREAGDLTRHRTHYDVTVMILLHNIMIQQVVTTAKDMDELLLDKECPFTGWKYDHKIIGMIENNISLFGNHPQLFLHLTSTLELRLR